ncbi:MAG TPA: ABC transporter substrate-binding protein [Chroococcidiopsis sp.]
MNLYLRPRSRRAVLGSLVGLSTALLLHACSEEPPPSETGSADAAEPLRIGVNTGNVPWEFKDDSGTLVGFEVDLVNAIAQHLGRGTEFIDIPFTGLFPAVLANRIDLAIASITITVERLKTFDFPQPYYDSDQSLTVKAGSPIDHLDDMRGKVVAVESGSTGDAWAEAHRSEYGFAEIRRYEGLAPAMTDLENGSYDAYLSDIPGMQYYTKDKTTLKVVQRIPTGEQYSLMFAKGNPLCQACNAVITTLKEDGTLAQIHEKWFGIPPEPNTSTAKVLDPLT